MKGGIVFALDAEEYGLRRVLSQSETQMRRSKHQLFWFLGRLELVVEVSGPGCDACARSVQTLIESGAEWIICAGFAAALDDCAQVGDIVIPDKILFDDINHKPLTCSEELISAIPPSGSFGYSIWKCSLITSDSVIYNASEKKEIYRATGAAALDMESYGAARVCIRNGVPFASIRVISDTANQDLPVEVDVLSKMNKWNQLLFTMSHPHIWPELWRLRLQADVASNNLGDVMGLMLLRLI